MRPVPMWRRLSYESERVMKLGFKQGLNHGVPIAIGYFFVSFAFGLTGSVEGMDWWQTMLISMTNLTSAGQFAGMKIMLAGGSLVELALSQLVINLRYSLMAISLSQKTDAKFRGIYRWILGFGITDEIYGVAAGQKEEISRSYFFGLMTLPYFGWAFGTMAGGLLMRVVPNVVLQGMGIALYGMFIAIVVPKAKEDHHVLKVCLLAIVFSGMFTYVPILNKVSVGVSIIICGLGAAILGAVFFPIAPIDDGELPTVEDRETVMGGDQA